MGALSSPFATESVSRKGLPANQLAASGARKFVRALLAERAAAPPATAGTGAAAISSELINTAVLLTSELVTNAVMYAGTDIDVTCRLEHGPPADSEEGRGRATVGVVLEVSDRHPARRVRGGVDARTGEPGYGLQLVSALAESWGVTYRQSVKTVWFRLEATEGEPGPVAPEPRREAPVRLTRHRRGRPSRAGTPPNGPTGAAPPSSPRPASCWPGSSTRTWSARWPPSCWCPGSPTGARSG